MINPNKSLEYEDINQRRGALVHEIAKMDPETQAMIERFQQRHNL